MDANCTSPVKSALPGDILRRPLCSPPGRPLSPTNYVMGDDANQEWRPLCFHPNPDCFTPCSSGLTILQPLASLGGRRQDGSRGCPCSGAHSQGKTLVPLPETAEAFSFPQFPEIRRGGRKTRRFHRKRRGCSCSISHASLAPIFFLKSSLHMFLDNTLRVHYSGKDDSISSSVAEKYDVGFKVWDMIYGFIDFSHNSWLLAVRFP